MNLDESIKRRVYEFIRPRRLWVKPGRFTHDDGVYDAKPNVLAKHGEVVLRIDGVVTINGEFKKRLCKRSDYGRDAVFTFRGCPQINDDWVSYPHPYDPVDVLESLHDDFKLEDRTAPFTKLTSTHYVIASGNQIRVTDLRTRTTKYIEAPEWPQVQLTDFICIRDGITLMVLDFNLHLVYWCLTTELYSISTKGSQIIGECFDYFVYMTEESVAEMLASSMDHESIYENNGLSLHDALTACGRFDEDGNLRPDEFDRDIEDRGPDMVL